MLPRLMFAGSLLLGLPGCVAAIPLVAQLATGATSVSQLCAAAKLPGQTASLCDQISQGANGATTPQTRTAQTGMTYNNGGRPVTIR